MRALTACLWGCLVLSVLACKDADKESPAIRKAMNDAHHAKQALSDGKILYIEFDGRLNPKKVLLELGGVCFVPLMGGEVWCDIKGMGTLTEEGSWHKEDMWRYMVAVRPPLAEGTVILIDRNEEVSFPISLEEIEYNWYVYVDVLDDGTIKITSSPNNLRGRA